MSKVVSREIRLVETGFGYFVAYVTAEGKFYSAHFLGKEMPQRLKFFFDRFPEERDHSAAGWICAEMLECIYSTSSLETADEYWDVLGLLKLNEQDTALERGSGVRTAIAAFLKAIDLPDSQMRDSFQLWQDKNARRGRAPVFANYKAGIAYRALWL